jgi:hypothetical protein
LLASRGDWDSLICPALSQGPDAGLGRRVLLIEHVQRGIVRPLSLVNINGPASLAAAA